MSRKLDLLFIVLTSLIHLQKTLANESVSETVETDSTLDARIFIGIKDAILEYDFKTKKMYVPNEIKDISLFDVTNTTFYVKKDLPVIYHPDVNVTFHERIQPQAIAFDYLTEKFYLIDKYAGTINVVDTRNKNFGIVLSNLENLHDIVLDVEQGLMFILQYRKSILRANLDGTDLRKIVENENVLAITLDRQRKKLYWTTKDEKITSSDYIGNRRTLVFEQRSYLGIKSISYYQNRLFWLSSVYDSNKIHTCAIVKEVCVNTTQVSTPFLNLQIVKAPVNIVDLENPCKINNGNCSFLCFLSANNLNRERVCACNVGYKLNPDLQTCEPVTDFILYLQENLISAVSADSKEGDNFRDVIIPMQYVEIDETKRSKFTFDYDWRTGNLYYQLYGTIKLVNIMDQTEPVTVYNSGSCHNFTYDWVSENIIYIQEGSVKTLSVKPGNRRNVKVGMMSDVQCATVDVDTERIYSVSRDFFYSMKIDGSDLEISPSVSENLVRSLIFDHDEGEMYALSHFDHNLTRIDLVAFRESKAAMVPLYTVPYDAKSASVHKEHMYLHNETDIWRVDKKSGKNYTRIVKVSGDKKLLGAKVFSTK